MHPALYPFMMPPDHERCLDPHRPRPRPQRPVHTVRPQPRRPTLRRIVGRRLARRLQPRPLLATHEYLELEFTVEERR